MAQLGHLAPRSVVRDVADLRQVGARSEDEGLARDREALNLAGGAARLLLVEHAGELEEALRTERAGARVVAPVVESHEGEGAAAGQRHVVHVGVRDDLVVAQGEELGELVGGVLAGRRCRRSHFFFFPV